MAVKKRRKAKPLLIFLVLCAFCLFALAGAWMYLSSPIDKQDEEKIEVLIPSGATSRQIGRILKEKGLIRDENFYNVYVKIYRIEGMKASTYSLSKNMSIEEILDVLVKGNSFNPDVIKITFKEGERITDYIDEIAKQTNNTAEDVKKYINDTENVKKYIDKYWFLTDAILDKDIYYPLEGYLAPNTYEFANKNVSIDKIIETMLNQTEKNLEKYKDKISNNTHYYLTLASLAELEGTNLENRKKIVSVFKNRVANKMNLGSDVTTYYALQLPMTSDLTTAQFNTVNPYNTRSSTMVGKMPIGPICNPSMSSIEASIEPDETQYYYFVADKNANIYFTTTLVEHNAKVKEIKDKGDWIW